MFLYMSAPLRMFRGGALLFDSPTSEKMLMHDLVRLAFKGILLITMKRILLIDDDSEVRRFLRVSLERAGYHVLEADNGKAGIELFRRAPVDLVVSDIFMPEKEGIETIRELRGEFPELKILAVSGGIPGLDPEYYLKMARKLGADASLEKPFNQKQFLESIYELLTPLECEDTGSEPAC